MTTPTEQLHDDIKKANIIDQINELAQELGGDVAELTCYDAKSQWKKITIEYDREVKS